MRQPAGNWRNFAAIFDPASLTTDLQKHHEEAADPTFWKDPSAKKRLGQQSALERKLKKWNDIEQTFEETDLLIELLETHPDQATEVEAANNLKGLERAIEHLTIETLLSGEKDLNNAILTIHPGAGGTESQDWAEMLTRMYVRWAEDEGYRVETLDLQPGDEAGIKSVTLLVEGAYAYGYLRSECGVHRLVRISPFDANKRRHTSFAAVFTSPELEDNAEIVLNEKDLRIDTYRASSAGGQHVNKTSSAIRITHLPTKTVVQCQNERSQLQNKESALKVLRSKLYEIQQQEAEVALAKITGEKKEIGWGRQIRSYVMQPYQMVKDHRTGLEVGDVMSVLDGRIDGFIQAYLKNTSRPKL